LHWGLWLSGWFRRKRSPPPQLLPDAEEVLDGNIAFIRKIPFIATTVGLEDPQQALDFAEVAVYGFRVRWSRVCRIAEQGFGALDEIAPRLLEGLRPIGSATVVSFHKQMQFQYEGGQVRLTLAETFDAANKGLGQG
jgi:hypothetical protein